MNAQMDIDKRNRHWVALLAFVFITHGGLLAQDKLSAMDAVKVGLERNFNIQILRNQETIAANNTPGRAGMLPTIGTTGTTSYSVNSTEQKFFTGESRGSNNASTIAFRLGLEVSWTAFDGFRMYVARDRFQTLEEQSRMRTTAEMQALAADILLNYYGPRFAGSGREQKAHRNGYRAGIAPVQGAVNCRLGPPGSTGSGYSTGSQKLQPTAQPARGNRFFYGYDP